MELKDISDLLDSKLAPIQKDVSEIKIRLNTMDKRFDAMDKRFDKLEGMIISLATKVSKDSLSTLSE